MPHDFERTPRRLVLVATSMLRIKISTLSQEVCLGVRFDHKVYGLFQQLFEHVAIVPNN